LPCPILSGGSAETGTRTIRSRAGQREFARADSQASRWVFPDPHTFRSNPSEWYRWEKDLRRNPDIDILLAVDSSSFPLGTGPKPHEIWHEGYYPVAWTNRKYRMIYFNFGHNDIDYEHKYDTTNRTLSHTMGNPVQDRLIVDALLWLGNKELAHPSK